jgi:hypothetical protein
MAADDRRKPDTHDGLRQLCQKQHSQILAAHKLLKRLGVAEVDDFGRVLDLPARLRVLAFDGDRGMIIGQVR